MYHCIHAVQVIRYAVNRTEIRSTCLNVRLMSNDPYHGRVFYGTFFAFAFVLPMTLICVLYACMIFRLLRGHNVGSGGGSGRHRAAQGIGSSESARARRRVTRLVVVVVAAFGACWLPVHVVFIVQYFTAARDESLITPTFVAVRLAANCLAYANSCLNPILYAFLSENFRSGLVRLCGKGSARHRNTIVELRGQREITRRQQDGGAAADDRAVRPLLIVVEERGITGREAASVEGCVSSALQLPTYNSSRRNTETTAMIETAL